MLNPLRVNWSLAPAEEIKVGTVAVLALLLVSKSPTKDANSQVSQLTWRRLDFLYQRPYPDQPPKFGNAHRKNQPEQFKPGRQTSKHEVQPSHR
ncbi:MAG: hypothetical protein KME29_14645 [Calothrix sp. FI2-JRJ7]|nr:hypothetical protein [Calothrix sp. FI2-JRJ7]